MDLSEKNPADDYIGKKFWIDKNVNSAYYSSDYKKGECEKAEVSYYPLKKQSFIVKKYIPRFYPFDTEVEALFDNDQIVCVKINSAKYNITEEDPTIKETLTKEELLAANIKKGKSLWLKYPMNGLPGLTKVTINKIEHNITDINITFESDDYKDYTVTFRSVDNITKNYYTKLPTKLAKLRKKAILAIAKHRIFIGMTSDEAIASWGLPTDVNRTAGKWGIHEQWIYGDNTYLYFENNKLTSWQD
jgi:hypothetical protein